ncbi:MAG: ABC transporter permease [Planctomycetota bacterium]|nr:ABC transporter permease [Planctomycetota bacterium]
MTDGRTERDATAVTAGGEPAGPPRSYGSIVWGQLKKRPSAMVSLLFIVLMALSAILAPFVGGEVPIRWVEDGQASWPIFHHLSNAEYVAMAAFLLGAVLPITIRLVRPGAERVGASPLLRALAIHAAVLAVVGGLLFSLREAESSYGFYLERADEADDAWFPPIAYPRNPGFSELGQKEQPPSWTHPLGTGRIGDDVLIRILYGARTALTIGFVAVGISLAIGVLLGAASGNFGGGVDLILMRVAEVFMSIPRLILIIIMVTVIPPRWIPPIWTVVLVLGVTGWTGTYRLMRAELLRIRGEDYMTAARALGVRTGRLLVRHAIPNGLAPILVGATFGIAGAVFLEVTLAFLGLVQTPSWGMMLNDGRQHLEYWWLWVTSGSAIFLTVFAYNLLGEGIRDAIDPRLRI